MTDSAPHAPSQLMSARTFEIVQRHQRGYSPEQPIRIGPAGRWLIFGHPSSTTYEVRDSDDLLQVLIGGEKENPSVDFTTNAIHAVDVFVTLELAVGYVLGSSALPEMDPDVTLTVFDETQTQRLEWPGGWAEGPTSRRGGERGWALPRMAHYITMTPEQILALHGES